MQADYATASTLSREKASHLFPFAFYLWHGMVAPMVRKDKNPLAVALGRLASAKLTKKQRTAKATHAALARWAKPKRAHEA